MADTVRKVNYCYVTVSGRAGQGAKVLSEITDAGINMLGFSGFPQGTSKAQLDILAQNISAVRKVATRSGWKLSPVKKGFLIQGQDSVGAVYRHLQKLADAGVSVTASNAISAGAGRYGMVVWVKPKDYAKAAKALKAK
jgi:hypothetical protein